VVCKIVFLALFRGFQNFFKNLCNGLCGSVLSRLLTQFRLRGVFVQKMPFLGDEFSVLRSPFAEGMIIFVLNISLFYKNILSL
ncbi:MAG: hypothetical protein IKR79_01510, partial [Bacteroidales bacterium]|nr:hypothetical protein [Bacteroidales bacterium]